MNRVSEVFVAGGLPEITYVARNNLALEKSLREHLEDGHQLICVTGPTKSGKTVLCKTVLRDDDPVWLDGGSIASEEDFWLQLGDELSSIEAEEVAKEDTEHTSTEKQLGGGVSIPGFSAEAKGSKQGGTANTRGRTTKVTRSPKAQAIAKLKMTRRCLVIDDFHYLDKELQTKIVRAMKAPIFDGVRMIVLAVPHRAYDAVRVEKEMTGRVTQVDIPEWTEPELVLIATKGFKALNISGAEKSTARFADECWKNPHLMQRFCSRICRLSDIAQSSELPQPLKVIDFDFFFEEIAKETAKKDFDRLARGPRQRSDRKVHKFTDGTSGDIYVVVLRALAETGPKPEVAYEDLRKKINGLLKESTLQMHEVSRVLIKMSERPAATDNSDMGIPPIDWDADSRKVHVIDPFFAYYLKWGAFRGS